MCLALLSITGSLTVPYDADSYSLTTPPGRRCFRRPSIARQAASRTRECLHDRRARRPPVAPPAVACGARAPHTTQRGTRLPPDGPEGSLGIAGGPLPENAGRGGEISRKADRS